MARQYLGERWDMRANKPSTWYHPEHSNGHVKKYQSQGQWDIRQAPKVHGAYADLWGTEGALLPVAMTGKVITCRSQFKHAPRYIRLTHI